MKLLKMVAGFFMGAAGAVVAAFLCSCYFFDDSLGLMFAIFGGPIAALVGGVIGAANSTVIRWSHNAFQSLGIFTLAGALLIVALWAIVPDHSTDADVLAIWFRPDQIIQRVLLAILPGAAVGAAIGQIAIAIGGEDLFHRRQPIAAETPEGVWPPAPTQET